MNAAPGFAGCFRDRAGAHTRPGAVPVAVRISPVQNLRDGERCKVHVVSRRALASEESG